MVSLGKDLNKRNSFDATKRDKLYSESLTMKTSMDLKSTEENQMRVSLNFDGSQPSTNPEKLRDEFELKYDSSATSK